MHPSLCMPASAPLAFLGQVQGLHGQFFHALFTVYTFQWLPGSEKDLQLHADCILDQRSTHGVQRNQA